MYVVYIEVQSLLSAVLDNEKYKNAIKIRREAKSQTYFF